jgi:hypothetical protein
MSEWLTVYCTRPVAPLGAADLLAFLRVADLHTAAEGFGIDDESIVDAAVARLRVIETSSDGVASNAPRFRVQYTDSEAADVLVHFWSDSAGVRTECDEASEELDDAAVTSVAVRSQLARTVEVVGIELPWAAGEMGFVLAVQSADYFARAGEGILRDQDDEWWVVSGGVLSRLE